MGLPLERFLGHVDESFLCNICQGVFLSPVVTDCGHTFCAKCLEGWISASCNLTDTVSPEGNVYGRITLQCPTCRYKLAPSTFSPNKGYDLNTVASSVSRPVLALRNFINGLLTYCEHSSRGCTFVGPVEMMQAGRHHLNCAYAPVDCAGCGHTVNQMELAEHQLHCFGIKAELSDMKDDELSSNCQRRVDVTTQTECLEVVTNNGPKITPTTSNCSTKSTQTARRRARSYSPTKSYRMTLDSEGSSLCMLKLSLIKLVYALEIELTTTQAELRLKKLLRGKVPDREL